MDIHSRFQHRMGSDIQRDGMFLELLEAASGDVVGEVFYSDRTGKFAISLERPDIPLEAVEALIAAARERLLPVPGRKQS